MRLFTAFGATHQCTDTHMYELEYRRLTCIADYYACLSSVGNFLSRQGDLGSHSRNAGIMQRHGNQSVDIYILRRNLISNMQ